LRPLGPIDPAPGIERPLVPEALPARERPVLVSVPVLILKVSLLLVYQ
jgi:hypothetical protein